MIILNAITLLIFFYVSFLKVGDWIEMNKNDSDNNAYRVMFFVFTMFLLVDCSCLILWKWSVMSNELFGMILSYSFFIFALVSLIVNTGIGRWISNLFK